MSSVLTCPKCQIVLESQASTGKPVKCPQCGSIVPPPLAAAKVAGKTPATPPAPPPKGTAAKLPANLDKVTCPLCHATYKLTAPKPVGSALKCPGCHQVIKIQAPKAASSTPASPTSASKSATGATKSATAQSSRAPDPGTQAATGPDDLRISNLVSFGPDEPESPATDAAVETPADEASEEKPPARPRRLWPLLAGLSLAIAVGVVLFITLKHKKNDVPEMAWVPFLPPMGHCQIMMPGTPLQLPGTPDSPFRQFIVHRPEQNSDFSIGYTAGDKKVIGEDQFDKIYFLMGRNIVMTNFDGELLDDRDISLDGHKGREYVVKGSDKRLHIGRVYMVEARIDMRIYILNAAGQWASPSDPAPTRFFESFRLPFKAKPADEPKKPADEPKAKPTEEPKS